MPALCGRHKDGLDLRQCPDGPGQFHVCRPCIAYMQVAAALHSCDTPIVHFSKKMLRSGSAAGRKRRPEKLQNSL